MISVIHSLLRFITLSDNRKFLVGHIVSSHRESGGPVIDVFESIYLMLELCARGIGTSMFLGNVPTTNAVQQMILGPSP